MPSSRRFGLPDLREDVWDLAPILGARRGAAVDRRHRQENAAGVATSESRPRHRKRQSRRGRRCLALEGAMKSIDAVGRAIHPTVGRPAVAFAPKTAYDPQT